MYKIKSSAKKCRIAIISSHPIQYNAPLFKLLAANPYLKVKVFYSLGESYLRVKDKGFAKKIKWDIPLLEDYEYKFLTNSSGNPSTSSFNGIVNPTIIDDITEFKPDIILVYGWSFDSHLKVLRHFKGKVKIYFRGDSTLLNEKPGVKRFIRKLFLTWVYSHIDKALYVGTNNRQYYLKYGLKEKNLVFAPHAIDNARFGNDILYNQEAFQLRESLKISKSATVFAFIGKFEEVKNPLLLLAAFKKIKLNNIALLMVGDGVLESALKQEAKEVANVHFLPFQNQSIIPSIYRMANVFVLPSVSETWGLAVNEAMACGLPVITSSKLGCAVDLVKEGRNGYIFESENLESLSEKLVLCASKPIAELKEMGLVSKELIADWNFDRVCHAFLDNLP
ncbi:glycosyltransferase family 4 protein [Pontibacter sp. SGAir0037]|uniref:glycosyltransferase family 4 protein n=1 Tax=Pontibacter sp. SGAir0037 TaxID=2571030 RepID=UPI0010CD2893|nr:glycosyltransferase family 4 protein [Pontibacter sp. SGAir0037]QCR22162.1 glycosyl transferase family 1 [Pontibacter sp. SGAir0037]